MKELDGGLETTLRTGGKAPHQLLESFLAVCLLCSSKLQFLSGFLACDLDNPWKDRHFVSQQILL